MKVQERTIKKIRNLINEETEYRSGPQLVLFFNELGFNDEYGQGFPSRWMFTDTKLNSLNNSSRIEESILKLLAPINFIGRSDELDKHIAALNEYLAYDGYLIERDNREVFIRERTVQDDEKSPAEVAKVPEINHGIKAGGSITAGGDIFVNGNKLTQPKIPRKTEGHFDKILWKLVVPIIVIVVAAGIVFRFGWV